MDEYIRREDAITAACKGFCHRGVRCPETPCKEQTKYLRGLPSADVVPVVHSQWKYKCGEIKCPECGNRIHRIDLSGCLNFCPNCGAKMDVQGEE